MIATISVNIPTDVLNFAQDFAELAQKNDIKQAQCTLRPKKEGTPPKDYTTFEYQVGYRATDERGRPEPTLTVNAHVIVNYEKNMGQ